MGEKVFIVMLKSNVDGDYSSDIVSVNGNHSKAKESMKNHIKHMLSQYPYKGNDGIVVEEDEEDSYSVYIENDSYSFDISIIEKEIY